MQITPTLTDADLVARFAALALPVADFGHREHVRVAFALLVQHGDFGAAAIELRRLLRAFADHHGAHGRYHETITWAYLAIIHERMAAATPPYADSHALLAANPDLLEQRALARYYDVAALIADPLAHRTFVLPRMT